MVKIGAITVGQSPRVDVTGDIMPIFGENVELIEAGGLDGLTRDEISKFAPGPEDYVLISRLNDGSSAIFAEKFILPRLQQCIHDLEEKGVELILFLCTGDFPAVFHSNVPLIFPCHVLNGLVPALSGSKKIAVVTPTPQQIAQSENKWKLYVDEVHAIAASPYGDPSELESAAKEISRLDVDLVVMDCIGYTVKMKESLHRICKKPVVLSRTIAARAVSELIS